MTQPTLNLLGSEPALFTVHEIDGWRAVGFVLVVALLPALMLSVVVLGSRVVSSVIGDATRIAVMSALIGITGVQLLRPLLGSGIVLTLVALLIAVGFGFAARRFENVGTWSAVLAPLPLLALGLMYFSESGEVLRGSAEAIEIDADAAAPSVVMVVLDELPTSSVINTNGEIDRVRFPNLARLGDSATWYPNATTLAPNTRAVLPSILTGNDPVLDSATAEAHPDNLFTLLEPTHRLTTFESVTQMCASPRCGELPTGIQRERMPRLGGLSEAVADVVVDRINPMATLELRLDQFEETGLGESDTELASGSDAAPRDAEEIRDEQQQVTPIQRVSNFIDAFTPSGQPVLYFLHVVLPHSPWRTYPDGSGYRVPLGGDFANPNSIAEEADPWIHTLNEQRHLLQAQYADRLVGEVLDAADAAGLTDSALFIVTADHGASFDGTGAFRDMLPELLADVAYVPLLVKEPGQDAGGVDDANLMVVDLLPTIADRVGAEMSWDPDGLVIGSEAVDERGDEKRARDFRSESEGRRRNDLGTITFDQTEHQPDASDRWVGDIESDESDLAALHRTAGIDDLIGRSADLSVNSSTDFTGDLARSIAAPRTPASPGILNGRLTGQTSGAEHVLLLDDGVVVAGAPIMQRGEYADQFALMVPLDAWTGDGMLTMAVRTTEGDLEELSI